MLLQLKPGPSILSILFVPSVLSWPAVKQSLFFAKASVSIQTLYLTYHYNLSIDSFTNRLHLL